MKTKEMLHVQQKINFALLMYLKDPDRVVKSYPFTSDKNLLEVLVYLIRLS